MMRMMAAAAALSLMAAGAAAAQDFEAPGAWSGQDFAAPAQDFAAPGAPVGQDFAAPGAPAAQEFSLYRGSEASLAYGRIRDLPDDGTADAFEIDTRHTLWIAPFLGAQIDIAGARSASSTLVTAGLHLHVLAEGGNRFGVFYIPTWERGEDARLDMYGVEAFVAALPALDIEARLGRFDGDDIDVEGPFVGAAGYFALDPQLAVTAAFEHSRLEFGPTDVNTTDVLIGADYFLPGFPLRISGGVGALRASGDIDSTTDFRVELGATYLLFGEPATTARTRTFGRQNVLGLF